MNLDEFKAYVNGIMTAYKEAGGSINSAKVLNLVVAGLQNVEPERPVYTPRDGGANKSPMVYANVPAGGPRGA